MSLLLEALKKAELAKQQGAAGADAEHQAAPVEQSAITPSPASGDAPLMTRDRLPDITQPLEILSEDLPSAAAPKPRAAPPAGEEPKPAAPVPPSRPLPGGTGEKALAAREEQERASAKQLFEAKSAGEYNPKKPFYLLIGVLGVAILGAVGYFAYQIVAPRPSFYTGPPGGKTTTTVAAAPATPAPAAAGPVAKPAAPPATAPVPPAPASTAPTPPAGPSSAGSPPQAQPPASSPPPQPAAPAPSPAPSAIATVPSAPQPAPATGRPAGRPAPLDTPASRPAPAPTPRESAAAELSRAQRPPVRINAAAPRVDPAVESGWQALQSGDVVRARADYSRALQANPLDRDALLGMASVEARSQNPAAADGYYQRILQIDPRDPYALAGLAALRSDFDPVQAESRLKNLLSQNPEAVVLNYALGNEYATQRRWAEAQQAYFKAYTGDPENADYAYNLAVSLDHMRQPRLALEYYQRALALAGSRPVGFNTGQVQARILELQR